MGTGLPLPGHINHPAKATFAVSFPQVHIFLIIINNNSRNTFNFQDSRRRNALPHVWRRRGPKGAALSPVCLNDIALTVAAFPTPPTPFHAPSRFMKKCPTPLGNCFRRLCPGFLSCFRHSWVCFFFFLFFLVFPCVQY